MIPANNASHRHSRPKTTAASSSTTTRHQHPDQGDRRDVSRGSSESQASILVAPGNAAPIRDDDGRINRLLPRAFPASASATKPSVPNGSAAVSVAVLTAPKPPGSFSSPFPAFSPAVDLVPKRNSQDTGLASKVTPGAAATATMRTGTGSVPSFAFSPSLSTSSAVSTGNNNDEEDKRPFEQYVRTQAVAAATASSSDAPLAFASSASSSSSSSSPFLHGSAMVVTDDSTRGASSLFSWQKLSLDRAVAPLLKQPVAPFVSPNHERKRALLNATYYSECFLHSIGPMDADTAALDAQSRYEKWWVESKYRGSNNGSESSGNNKRRRVSVQSAPAATAQIHKDNNDIGDSSDGVVKKRPVAIIPSNASVDAFVETDDDNDLPRAASIAALKAALVEDLRQSGGDVSSPQFVSCLDQLHALYKASGADERWGPSTSPTAPSDGTWIALSKPTFTECRGRNDRGQYLYTLGRLSFDMFRPTSLLCSLRGVFNTVSLPEGTTTTTGGTSHASSSMSSSSSDDEDTSDGIRGGGQNAPGRAASTPTQVDEGTSGQPMRRPRSCPSRLVRSLQERYGKAGAPVRTYDIVVAFTIEPHQTRRGQFPVVDAAAESGALESPTQSAQDASPTTPAAPPTYRVRRPIRGLLTNHGYMIPDPTVPNRLSIWFSGGTLECHQDEDLDEWKELFYHGDLPRRDLGELARVLAAKVLLGATSIEGMADDGSMSYQLRRPIGGHGQVFCDVLYSDCDLRVLRGHHGTVYVHRRVPDEESRSSPKV